jgi:peptidoglycan-associated lipoprotein
MPPPSADQTLSSGDGAETVYFRLRDGDYTQKDLLGQVFFSFDGSSIGADDLPLIRSIATTLREFPDRTVMLVGYCDWYGDEAYNLALGQRRADAVARMLQREGIGVERIQTQSRGAHDSPIDLPKHETRYDRRVDILRR